MEGEYVVIPQTFLSHNQADSAWVEQLHADLCRRLHITRASNRIYLDRHMAPGVLWTEALWTTFEQSLIFLVAVSQHSAQSAWVREECTKALALKEKDHRRIIIPLILDYAGYRDQITPDLRCFQYADFTGLARDRTRVEYHDMLRRLAYVMEHYEKFADSSPVDVPIPLEPLWKRSVRKIGQIYLGD